MTAPAAVWRVPMTEDDLMVAVTDMADRFHWSWAHFRPARTEKGWRTAVSGPLGAGWPDLVLTRALRGVLFVELKEAGGRLSPFQVEVHRLFRESGVPIRTWRPADLDDGTIESVLR